MGQISFHFVFLMNVQTAKLLNSGLKVIICSLKSLSLILIQYFLCGIGWHFSLILYLICCVLKAHDFMYLCPSHYLPQLWLLFVIKLATNDNFQCKTRLSETGDGLVLQNLKQRKDSKMCLRKREQPFKNHGL